MSKKHFFGMIAVSVLIGWIFSIFPGRFLLAKISTWPVLNQWKIISPQAPIVITNRETVRVSDSGDLVQAADQVKSKISSVVVVSGASDIVTGSAVNVTSDGSFVTGASTFISKSGNYFVVLNDGRQAKITSVTPDPATSLVFFKAALDNVPSVSLAPSKDLSVGEKVLFVQGSLKNFSDKALTGTVYSTQDDFQGELFQSDYPRRAFSLSISPPSLAGQAVVNSNADVLGIWNGAGLISSDVLKQSLALYIGNQKSVVRPSFGFSFTIVTQNDSKLTGQNEGALVKDVAPGLAASRAGLLPGDIISKADSQEISERFGLEEALEKYKPGDQLVLTVLRKTQTLTLTLTVGQLK